MIKPARDELIYAHWRDDCLHVRPIAESEAHLNTKTSSLTRQRDYVPSIPGEIVLRREYRVGESQPVVREWLGPILDSRVGSR